MSNLQRKTRFVLAALAGVLVAPIGSFAQGFPQEFAPNNRQEPPNARSELFRLAETVARVGNQDIYQGDLEADANIILIPTIEKIPKEELAAAESQIVAQREQLAKQALREAVQRKLMYAMFLQTIPAEKLDEAMANIKERVSEQFNESLEEMLEKVQKAEKSERKDVEYRKLSSQSSQLFRIAYLMNEMEIATLRELDLLLHRYGTSIAQQQQAYAEDQLGRQEMYREARSTAEVTYDDMVAYYQNNLDDFRVPTRAKWEQITIKFSEFSTKFEAGEAIVKIGNELFFGANFKQVAKRSSQGDNADEGGFHDWTERGNFKISREINDAVFAIEPGKLSGIITDAEGLHIVRVIERQQAHVIPFADAQTSIKESINNERRQEAITKYLADLQDRIPVWTIYDEPDSTEQIANPLQSNSIR